MIGWDFFWIAQMLQPAHMHAGAVDQFHYAAVWLQPSRVFVLAMHNQLHLIRSYLIPMIHHLVHVTTPGSIQFPSSVSTGTDMQMQLTFNTWCTYVHGSVITFIDTSHMMKPIMLFY